MINARSATGLAYDLTLEAVNWRQVGLLRL